MQKKDNKKEVKKAQSVPSVCCPYFDEDKKRCVHPDCIRRLGFECKYSNRNK